jgi:metallo-beta-lactamase family protein
MDLLFLGAAREVTGSAFLLTAGGQHVLIDCGMEQGYDTYENQRLPVKPSQVDCVVLTHAHIDHSGMIPALVKQGFSGPIYATRATIELCSIMLLDSAHIQENEAEWRNRKSKRAGRAEYVPLYTQQDALDAVALMREASYTELIDILPGFRLMMTDAGHLLGSASTTLEVTDMGVTRRVVFSGDIGNLDQPMLNDPTYLTSADIVVMESTYGDRDHGERPDYVGDLVDTLQTTFDRGGNVVIPSFAVGRTQEVLYVLRDIKQRGLVRGHDGFPVYMDSPLAIRATNVFTQSDAALFDEEMNALLDAGINPITFDDLNISLTVDESKAINVEKRPCVIISASGMAEAGRIRHHLKHNLWRPESTILFVGYQSVGTLGRVILDGAQEVKLFGETIQVRAQIRALKALSGHADRAGLKAWADSFTPRPRKFFIVHGEESSALSFAQLLESEGHAVEVPYSGDRWDLINDYQLQQGPRTLAGEAAKAAEAEADLDTGRLMPRKERRAPTPAVENADRMLDNALNRLRGLIHQGHGWSNGIKKQLARQINKLCDKWE